MARISTSNLNEQNQILSNIDSFLACLEKFPDDACPSQSISVNPMEFLLNLLFRLGKQDKLIDFLNNLLKKQIPALEITIKGILLANLKKITNCSLDPRIPDYARESGITLDLGLIDIYESLNESPLDNTRNQLYMACDTDTATSPYSFLRGNDFNTFLWYILHRGRYPNPSLITNFDKNNGDLKTHFNSIIESGDTILDIVQLNQHNIIEGNSFKQGTTNGISRGISVSVNQNNKDVLMPVGSEQDRTTYYVNRASYFDFIKGENNRNYNNDIPLCSLKYIGEVDSNFYTYPRKKINIKIMEKPFIHIMNGPLFVLFDTEGNPNQNGKYTVRRLNDTTPAIKTSDFWYYEIEKPNGGDGTSNYYLAIKPYGNYKIIKGIDENKSYDEQTSVEGEGVLPFLHECYSNLTVYEFNYDYVMSMRLFDEKVITAKLINTLCFTSLGNVTLSLSSNYHVLNDRISAIIKKMIESDDTDASDCYFSFSNEDIEEKLHQADLKHASLVPFGETNTKTYKNYEELTSLINNFASETTLEGSSEILKRMVTVVEATISDEKVSEKDSYSLKYGILSSFTMNLVTILVNSILTPKVMTAFALNYELYGGKTDGLSVEDLLEKMIAPITSVVKEIRDLIIRELYNYLIIFLRELCVLIQQKVLLEQVNNYRKIVKKMLEECVFNFGSSQTRLNTSIDNVTYADINSDDINKVEPKC